MQACLVFAGLERKRSFPRIAMKISSFWMNIVRGMVIGLANIIPGVSGGTMMVSMGIYDKLIHAVTHLFSDFKKSMKLLLPIFIGILLALALLAKLFDFLLLHYPIATNLGFCGLILGSLPAIFLQVKHKGFNASMAISFAVFFVIVIGGALFSETSGASVSLNTSLPGLFMLFVVGVISAATMVIPGVSGSMMLMLMGYYEPIINLVSDTVDNLIHFNMAPLGHDILLAIPFGLGVILGIFAIAKLIEWVLNRWRLQTYWAIIGLILASPIAILLKTDWSAFSFLQLIIGLAACVLGAFAALKLADFKE